MPRFSIAFMTPEGEPKLIHKIIESETKELALRKFFNDSVTDYYSSDEDGFHYFKEDFFEDSSPAGSIIEL
ncbi:MAG: hypothetical protein N2053_04260 [Chitinispirillaceae bacterium]|nr:hypothetical protein [Chitinispirillaceae bacterium]